MQCCTCSKRVHLGCSQPSFSKFRTLGSSHSWSCIPASGDNSVISSSNSSSLCTTTVQSGLPYAIAALPPHPRLQTSYSPAQFVSSPSAPSSPPYAPDCLSIPPVFSSPLTPSGFFNGMLEVPEQGALNCYTFCHLIPLTLFVSRNLILNYLLLSGSLDSLLCNLIAPTPGMAFSLLMPRTLATASSFSSGRAYASLNFLPPLFS